MKLHTAMLAFLCGCAIGDCLLWKRHQDKLDEIDQRMQAQSMSAYRHPRYTLKELGWTADLTTNYWLMLDGTVETNVQVFPPDKPKTAAASGYVIPKGDVSLDYWESSRRLTNTGYYIVLTNAL